MSFHEESRLTTRSQNLQAIYEQARRAATAFELLSGAWCAGELAVRSLHGSEAMSRCFRFDVEFQSDIDPAALHAGLVARSATLLLRAPQRAPRVVHGVVAALRAHGALASSTPGTAVYTARLVPRLWLLKRRHESRVFQDMTVTDVVDEVLGAFGVARRWALEQRPRPRAYCVQYQESAFDFITRELAAAGVHYRFEAPAALVEAVSRPDPLDPGTWARVTADGEILVLSDEVSGYGAVEPDDDAPPGASAVLAVRDTAADALTSESTVTSFTLERRVREKSVTMRDYEFQTPQTDLSSHVALPTDPTSLAAGGARMAALLGGIAPPIDPRLVEHYDHRGDFEEPDAASTTEAMKLLQRLRARAVVGAGKSFCRRLSAGLRFTLADHAHDPCNREYVVSRVEHRGVVPSRTEARDGAVVYSNSFECAPSDVVLRPRERARALQQVLEVATVTGPPGEDIYTDRHGRVKVQFPWDRHGRFDDRSSCWIRVAQTWAGGAWGAQFIPRVGMEVIVSFLGGDVDRPMVLGCAYNGVNEAPFGLPHSRSRAGWRTHSTPGGAGFNELSFEDLAGREQVFLHAQKDFDAVVENDHSLDVRNDDKVTVRHNQVHTVGGVCHHEVMGVSQTVVHGEHCTLSRHGRHDVVEGDRNTRTGGDIEERVSGAQRVEVRGAREVTLLSDDLTRAKGSVTTVVGGREAKRTWLVHTVGDARVEGTESVELSSDKEVVLRCGKSVLRLTPERIELSTPSLVMVGGGAGLTVEKDELRVRAKKKVQVLSEKVLLKSKRASIELSTDAHVDGERVLLKSPASVTDPVEPTRVELTHIEVLDQQGTPMAHSRYRIIQDDGRERCGVLDDRGRAEVELTCAAVIEFPDLRDVERG